MARVAPPRVQSAKAYHLHPDNGPALRQIFPADLIRLRVRRCRHQNITPSIGRMSNHSRNSPTGPGSSLNAIASSRVAPPGASRNRCWWRQRRNGPLSWVSSSSRPATSLVMRARQVMPAHRGRHPRRKTCRSPSCADPGAETMLNGGNGGEILARFSTRAWKAKSSAADTPSEELRCGYPGEKRTVAEVGHSGASRPRYSSASRAALMPERAVPTVPCPGKVWSPASTSPGPARRPGARSATTDGTCRNPPT